MKITKLLKFKGLNKKPTLRSNIGPFYSGLLNKQIDLSKNTTKVNSQSKFADANLSQETINLTTANVTADKSLKNRVLVITKLNNKINRLLSINRFNLAQIGAAPLDATTHSNVKVKTVKSGVVLNKSKSSEVSNVKNILDYIPSPKKDLGKNKKYVFGSRRSRLRNFSNSNYLNPITTFEPEIAQFQNIVYNFNNNKKKFKINSILENSFYTLKSLIGTPVYEITPNNITINLFYYLKKNRSYRLNLFKLYNKPQLLKHRKLILKYLKSLIFVLSKKFNKPINLDLTRLFHPTLDSKISANALGIIANKLQQKFLKLSFQFFDSANIKNPREKFKNVFSRKNINSTKLAFITGINLKKGGRLITQPIIPKLTTKIMQIGTINRANTDFVTTSRYTAKSKRGAFSITVTMGHKFF